MAFSVSVGDDIPIVRGAVAYKIRYWGHFQWFSSWIFIPRCSQCYPHLQPHFLSPHPSITPHCSSPCALSAEYMQLFVIVLLGSFAEVYCFLYCFCTTVLFTWAAVCSLLSDTLFFFLIFFFFSSPRIQQVSLSWWRWLAMEHTVRCTRWVLSRCFSVHLFHFSRCLLPAWKNINTAVEPKKFQRTPRHRLTLCY